jgi:hypothetical protein
MRTISTAAALTLALTAFAPLSAQMPTERKLQVTFDQQGSVTVIAQNVTIAEILAEWARQGGTVMVNANRLAGGPVTRFYANRPEAEVIESLLRQAGGYIATPRRAGVPGASRFEVVQITPTPAATAASYSPPPTSAPVSAPLRTTGSPDDEIPPVVPPGVTNLPAPAPSPAPAPAPAPTGYPGTSGVAVPVVPVIPVPGGGRTGGAPTTPPPGTTGRGGGGGGF